MHRDGDALRIPREGAKQKDASPTMLEKILVPSDLSDESNFVIPYAVTLAQAFHSKLYLLHVMDPASLKGPENLWIFRG